MALDSIIGELTGSGNLTILIKFAYNQVRRATMPVTSFWQHLDALIAAYPLIIDRPRGTRHPHFTDFFYPYDYGHLSGTLAGDGQSIDVWLGSITGTICIVDLQKCGSEIKLLFGCTQEEAKGLSDCTTMAIRRGYLFCAQHTVRVLVYHLRRGQMFAVADTHRDKPLAIVTLYD
jgi:inorganic pyrophosphatase